MAIIEFGPWAPDSSGLNTPVTVNLVNARPVPKGFAPVGALAPASDALPGQCVGAGSAIASTGAGVTIAGTATNLNRAQAGGAWIDVTRATGGPYATPLGERWRFAQFTNVDLAGDLLIATNGFDVLQKLDLTGDPVTTRFEALGGDPPRGRYIATGFNGFTILANLLADTGPPAIAAAPNRVWWSDQQNPENWTPVTGGSLSGFQDITPGGPINAITSGEIVYIFQRDRIVRMIFTGGLEIMQFDEVEGGRGSIYPNSFVEVGDRVYYLGLDGFYALSKTSGRSLPIGANKINDFFFVDKRTDNVLEVYAGADPVNNIVYWAYIGSNNSTQIPDSVLLYDWSLEGSGREWGQAEISVTAISDFITQGVVLDAMDPFGPLDFLPFGLDSPVWAGGQTILGIFGTDDRLSTTTGSPLAATIDTRELVSPDTAQRTFIERVRPIVDTNDATVAVAVQETQGDPLTFTTPAPKEADGFCGIYREGRFFRGRMQVPAGADWTLAQGFDPVTQPAGEI